MLIILRQHFAPADAYDDCCAMFDYSRAYLKEPEKKKKKKSDSKPKTKKKKIVCGCTQVPCARVDVKQRCGSSS